MLAIDSGIVYDNTRHLSKTYKRKPEEQLNMRFKKEGKLYERVRASWSAHMTLNL